MYAIGLTLLAMVLPSLAWTVPEYVEERHVVEIRKRQADVSQLLQLASLAGITQLPTNPAVLLELGPVANSLASALPTSSVLAVLLTAAPSGFVSSIVNDPSYANSFESAFSAGSSPSWFNGLPTDVKSYLHTYSGFGGLATAAGVIKGVTQSAASETIAGGTATGIRPLQISGSSGEIGSSIVSGPSTASGASGTTAATGSSSGMSGMATSGPSVSSQSAYSASTASAAAVSATRSSTASKSMASSASSQGAATRPTGAMAVGLAGAFGILGAAVAL